MFQFWLAPVYFSFLFFLGSCVPQLEGPPRLRDHRAQKWRTQAKTPFGATPTVPQRLPRTLVRLPNYLMASCSLFKRFAQSALVRLPNYLMASCSLLLGSLDLLQRKSLTWISAAPVAPCLFICQRLPLCHAPLQRKSLHGPPQRQSLHVDIQFIVSACRSCSTSLAVAPVASRTWSPYSSSRSIHMHHVIMHQRCRYMSVVST